jgi:hypothetical protein
MGRVEKHAFHALTPTCAPGRGVRSQQARPNAVGEPTVSNDRAAMEGRRRMQSLRRLLCSSTQANDRNGVRVRVRVHQADACIQNSGDRSRHGLTAHVFAPTAFVCSISSFRIIDVHSCPRAEQFDAALIQVPANRRWRQPELVSQYSSFKSSPAGPTKWSAA